MNNNEKKDYYDCMFKNMKAYLKECGQDYSDEEVMRVLTTETEG
jgi:hypothetical protein